MGYVFSSNMQSEIRIVQYLLRPNRLEINNLNKKAYIIIPYIDDNDKSYEKVRNIIYQMRNVDENIEQKIIVLIERKKENTNIIQYNKQCKSYNFEENKEELNKIKIRLKYSKTLNSKFTEEQNEYNYIKSLNKSLNIQSKNDYNEKWNNLHCDYISKPEEYFKKKGVWINWYDFICIDTSKFVQSKQEWIKICKEKKIMSLKDYDEICKIYKNLPKEPACFYKDFTNIIHELKLNIIKRR